MKVNLESAFEAERPRLTSIAARVLGSTHDADDVIQEAWLRLSRTDAEQIDSLPAWLTSVVTRLCLDHLRKRKTRSDAEAEPLPSARPVDPADDSLLADQVGEAMHVVMGALTPAERVAFVLHDVFGYPFEDIGSLLGRSSAAARKLASRARRKVHGAPESASERADNVEHQSVVNAFLAAARNGEMTNMLTLLAPEAVMRADAVAIDLGTAPFYDGAPAIAERFNGARGAVPVEIDGELGAAWIMAGVVKVAFVFHLDRGLVNEIELIADPETLGIIDVRRLRRLETLGEPDGTPSADDGTGSSRPPSSPPHEGAERGGQ